MFTAKKSHLGGTPNTSAKAAKATAKNGATNPFVRAAQMKTAETTSGNGSLKFNTSGNEFVDQFNKLGQYKQPRSFEQIAKECELLWAEDKRKAVLFTFYLRLINRQVVLFDGSKTSVPQKGGELKHEAIMRMMWLHWKDKEAFWKNIGLFASSGSWNDIIKMLQYDLVYNDWDGRVLDWNKFGELILAALNNTNTSELMKKYLPQIRANKNCNTVEAQADNIIAKWICSLIFGTKGEATGKTYKQYRKMKTSGTAHQWQQLISQGKHKLIDFNTVHGRALMLMSRSKYLKNQGLEDKYNAWIVKPESKVAFTGFVNELFMKLPKTITSLEASRRETINRQFQTLVDKCGNGGASKLIVVRDTSGSMGSPAVGFPEMSSYDIAKAMALFFSEYQTGTFADSWIEFNNTASMRQWTGNSPVEKWYNDSSQYNGGTNFMSVIQLFCQIKSQGVAEADFPTGILCISDGNFNPASLGKTNVESALALLRRAGFSEEYVSSFVIALWDIPNGYYGGNKQSKFETMFDVPNVFYFSGYSASIISFLSSKIRTASELVDEALSQELMQMVQI